MLAFCIIIGDTIPPVMSAMFPSLEDMNFLWLLTDRRAVIVMFVLCVSYPLSLYRDIAKVHYKGRIEEIEMELDKEVRVQASIQNVSIPSLLLFISLIPPFSFHHKPQADLETARQSQHSCVDKYARHYRHRRNPRLPCPTKPPRPSHWVSPHQRWHFPSHWSHLICIRLPPQQPLDIWLSPKTYSRSIRHSNSLFNNDFHGSMLGHGIGWLPNLWQQDARKRPQQLPLGQYYGQYCTIVRISFPSYQNKCLLLTNASTAVSA
jgi:hypothetical protein